MAKTDSRVIENDKRIRKAYLKLIKTKPINKITVMQICEEAGINRGTFYNHYLDIYDLAEKMEQESIQKLKDMIGSGIKGESKNNVAAILTKIKSSSFSEMMLSTEGGNKAYVSRISEECSEIFANYIDEISDAKMDESRKNMYYKYIAGGCGSVIKYWFENGMKESPEEVADLVIKLSDNTVLMLGRDA